ncbi:MAG: hypothetical protein WC967_15625 [Balneolaceae bacterium]
MKILTNLDLSKNMLQNAVFDNLTTAPSDPVKGLVYFKSDSNILQIYNGTDWTSVGITYSFASGTTNGAFEVTPLGGSAQTVSIYGLGSAAFTNTNAYAPSAHTHSALTLKFNTGTTEGTDLYTYIGNTAKTIDIKSGTGLSLVSAANSITLNHSNTVVAGNNAEGGVNRTLTFGGTFNVPHVIYDAQGHITGKGSITLTMPANPNTDTATAVDNILDGSNTGTAITYAPYTTSQAGSLRFYTHATNPTGTDRLNLGGYFYATKLYSGGTEVSVSTHNHTLDSLSDVTITTIASGEILKWNGSAWINNTLAEAGISATHSHPYIAATSGRTVDHVPVWGAVNGTSLGNGYSVQTTLSSSTTALVRADAIYTAINNAIGGLSGAMMFKGTIGTGGTVAVLPTTYSVGWTYRVIEAGTYAGVVCEIGDMITAIVARTGTGNLNSDWSVGQANLDGAVIGPTEAVNNRLVAFDGVTGKLIKDSGLLPTTVGRNLITLPNPNAVAFMRINADNTVSTLSATDFRNAIGAGTSSTVGTVTSVSAGNGMNFTTITGSGSVTMGTPSSISATSTNSVTTNSHTHAISGFAKIFSQTLSTSATSYVITHNLNTQDIVVGIREVAAPYEYVLSTVKATTANTATIEFNTAPVAGTYRVIIHG